MLLSGLPVALGLPRSAFLAEFQPAGASESLPGAQRQKQHKTSTKKTPIYIYIYIYIYTSIDLYISISEYTFDNVELNTVEIIF
jgi:hypothetical protein